MQVNDGDEGAIGPAKPKAKKIKKLKFESIYLDELPSAEMYERSYMHRDVVSQVVVCGDVRISSCLFRPMYSSIHNLNRPIRRTLS